MKVKCIDTKFEEGILVKDKIYENVTKENFCGDVFITIPGKFAANGKPRKFLINRFKVIDDPTSEGQK